MSKAHIRDLPPSKDDFWADADTHINKVEHKKCGHLFARRSGREVVCEKCGVGYIIDGRFYLNGRHVYYEGEIVI